MDLALCEFMWLKRFNLTRSDISVRKSFNFEIPELMKRTFWLNNEKFNDYFKYTGCPKKNCAVCKMAIIRDRKQVET